MEANFQAMFDELRAHFNRRIPGGLTFDTNDRLRRTLESTIRESGSTDKQDILRRAYDSMATWMKGSETAIVQQKDILQPHEDTVKYREVEYNIVANSQDRNWFINSTQNRYRFTLQFNTNFRPQGYGFQPIINARLRNITRIEFIKAILPVEGLNTPILKDLSGTQYAFESVLSLPSVNILVDEVVGNTFGTNNDLDKTLAVCQYDATWATWPGFPGSVRQSGRGYTLFFPKFMKAQRVYSPTPLANLQTLSFQIQDPQGNLLSDTPDSSTVVGLYLGSSITGSVYSSGSYIFLNTATYFPMWSYSQMDKLAVQGIPGINPGFVEWIQDSAGQTIVGIGHGDASGLTVTDGPNSVGYANWLIIQKKLASPETGSTSVAAFSANDTALMASITTTLDYPAYVLNLSRQVQLYIRLITREYDLVSNVRADNV
jgi:hypothetical protein